MAWQRAGRGTGGKVLRWEKENHTLSMEAGDEEDG